MATQGVYRAHFKNFYDLLPDGKYRIKRENYYILFNLGLPRRSGDPITQSITKT